jgi:hypothetical protein
MKKLSFIAGLALLVCTNVSALDFREKVNTDTKAVTSDTKLYQPIGKIGTFTPGIFLENATTYKNENVSGLTLIDAMIDHKSGLGVYGEVKFGYDSTLDDQPNPILRLGAQYFKKFGDFSLYLSPLFGKDHALLIGEVNYRPAISKNLTLIAQIKNTTFLDKTFSHYSTTQNIVLGINHKSGFGGGLELNVTETTAKGTNVKSTIGPWIGYKW